MFGNVLHKVIEGHTLNEQEAFRAMETIMRGEASSVQIGSFLTALRLRKETVEEIVGFAKAMRSFSVSFESPYESFVDTCGTGGDGADTFNISTAVAFVAAAAGVPVAKHGNRAVSSKSGSADVLQQLGVAIDLTAEEARECLRQVGICFLFAPLYHPAMKHAVGPRKELGFRTVFNVLGPLTNPARAPRQVLGVYAESLVPKIADALARLGTKHALVVHGNGGLDELSVSGESVVAEVKDGTVQLYRITPEQFGLRSFPLSDIKGGNASQNAAIIQKILTGDLQNGAREIVTLNAGASIYVGGKANSLQQGVQMAKEAIDSGRALQILQRLKEFTQAIVRERAVLMKERKEEVAQ
jgi:anthranilate phosphoribosyltransferase